MKFLFPNPLYPPCHGDFKESIGKFHWPSLTREGWGGFVKLFFFILLSTFSFFLSTAGAYFFGLKSADDTISNIQKMEEKHFSPEKGKIWTPVVAFIFDPRGPHVTQTLDNLSGTLGANRIYHITLAPDTYSAKQVAKGRFDTQYKAFFQSVKKNNLRVIFRTMHEMNGGRYPRGSDPANFQKAWIHVRELSRAEGLDTGNILFDFSVNHRDMPTKEVPSQTAKLIPCQLSNKEAKQCPTFEDYYPGDKYVDIMGFTFYNRGKASYNRAWLTPTQIVNQKGRDTLKRIKKYNKPIFIDEVATTAVRYEGEYNATKSKEIYTKEYDNKNKRITQLRDFMRSEPDILGCIYFNVDFTYGLTNRPIGEADRAAINLSNGKKYNAIFDLVKNGDSIGALSNPLLKLFSLQPINSSGTISFVPSKEYKQIRAKLKAAKKILNTTTK